MTITADIYEVTATVVAVSVIVLTAFGVQTLVRLGKTARAAEAFYTETKATIDLLNAILGKAGRSADEIAGLITRVKEAGCNMAGTLDALIGSLKAPVLAITGLIAGIETLLRHLFKHRQDGDAEGSEKGKG